MGYQPFDPTTGPSSRRQKEENDRYSAAFKNGLGALAAAKRGEYADTGATSAPAQQPSLGSQLTMAGDTLAGAISTIGGIFPRSTPAAPSYQYDGPDYSAAYKGVSSFYPSAWKT